MNIKILADSTCDLSAALVEKYGITKEEATSDVTAYVEKMLDAEIIEVR